MVKLGWNDRAKARDVNAIRRKDLKGENIFFQRLACRSGWQISQNSSVNFFKIEVKNILKLIMGIQFTLHAVDLLNVDFL